MKRMQRNFRKYGVECLGSAASPFSISRKWRVCVYSQWSQSENSERKRKCVDSREIRSCELKFGCARALEEKVAKTKRCGCVDMRKWKRDALFTQFMLTLISGASWHGKGPRRRRRRAQPAVNFESRRFSTGRIWKCVLALFTTRAGSCGKSRSLARHWLGWCAEKRL